MRMKYKHKRILSLLLAILMVINIMPVPVTYAVENTSNEKRCTCGYLEYIEEGDDIVATSGNSEMAGHAEDCSLYEDEEIEDETGGTDPVCNCRAEGEEEHVATCPKYTCPDCGMAGWHEVCPETATDPNADRGDSGDADGDTSGDADGDADGEEDGEIEIGYEYTDDNGKYAEFIEDSYRYWIGDGSDFSGDSGCWFVYDDFEEGTIVYIRNGYYHLETEALWYQVEFYKGGVIEEYEEDWPEEAWVLQAYLGEGDDNTQSLQFVEIEENPDACDIYGESNCQAFHFYCSICEDYGCGLTHLYCHVCEEYDCVKNHVYCSYCDDYDCELEHEDIYIPVTEPVLPDNPELLEGEDVTIVDEYGDPVTEDGFFLLEGMKSSLSAWGDWNEDVTYQWQICYDSENELWTDIQGQTGKGILASPAMFLNAADENDEIAIRCVVLLEEEPLFSSEIPVTLVEPISAFSYARTLGAVEVAETDVIDDSNEEGEELQKAYVVVQYVYSDGRTAASTDFAEIIPGNAYSHSYTLPEIPGYKATLNTHSYGDSAVLSDDTLIMNFAANVLNIEYTIFTVTYVPDYVSYTVIHYWQNVDNDNYTEHERETITTTHKTGEVITDAHKDYPGFYNLLYETPAAADGSTVIEVYYDRYYHLMTFDLGDMGYGVDPIYARYGDAVEIGTPTRAGHIFLGWTLNGVEATVPSTMPSENREYVAQWQAPDTATVNVVVWGENPDDEGYSYFKTEEITVQTGSTISWENLKYNCGQTAHSHSVANDCYELKCDIVPHDHTNCNLTCGMTIHTHSAACCTKASEVHTLGTSCYGSDVGNAHSWSTDEQGVDGTKSNGSIGESYYWLFGNQGTGKKYIYINDRWYRYTGSVAIGGTAPVVCNGIHSHSDHTCTYCNLPVHASHSDACYDCGLIANDHQHDIASCYTLICTQTEHTHVSGCEVDKDIMDTNLWYFVKSDTVTVEANGSTVLNVYYDRRTFDLVFKVNSKTVKTITDKWGADIHTQFPIMGDNGTDYKGAEWKVPDGCETFEFGTNVLSIDIMPSEDIEFTRNSQSDDAKLYYYIEVLSEDECTREYNGRHYKLYKTVYLPNSGRLTESEEFHDIAGFEKGDFYPSGIFSSVKEEMWLYYTRNSYDIQFYNPTDLIKTQENVPYQMSLSSYNWTPAVTQAPAKYAPGSVQVGGWYLNPDCTGEQFDFSKNTMPAGPNNVDGEVALALYAKWEPVEYKVNYYLTKDSLTRGENIPTEMARLVQEAITSGEITEEPATDPYTTVFAEKIVKHGAYIGEPGDPEVAEGYEKLHPRAGYDFIGWFYLNDSGEETAFDPKNMPVHQDLNLYAKWSSNVLCYYNVYFALDENADGKADVDTDGNIIYVADPISGSAIAGRTYTFTAKGGEDLYNPDGDVNYQEGYFPAVGSHSIVIDIQDEAGVGANSFTFLYRPRTAVPYTVKYLEEGTNKVLYTQKYVADNKNVVVTENFVYIKGYMPDAYQKTLVVTDDSNESNDVIIFYYTEDKEHALYVVNYYIQDLNDDLTHKGWTKYTSLQNQGDIGTSYSSDAITIDGFTLSQSYTDDYNVNQKKNGMDGTGLPAEVGALTGGKLTGTLTDKGMELNFYYTRNLYPYEFRYMLNGTTTELADPEFGKAGYDSIVTKGAKEIIKDLDGDGIYEDYRLYDPTETTKDIHIIKDGDPLHANSVVTEGQATVNVTTFYYVRCTQTMTIKKKVIDNSAELNPDPNQEFAIRLLIHSTSGYHMSSYEYTKSGGETGILEPAPSAPNTLQFTLRDGETITIEGLPTAEYTVSELNPPIGYYDTYSPTSKNKLTVDKQLEVVVTNTFEPANLTITKTVDVVEDGNTPEVKDFEFTMTVPSGATGTYSYIVGSDARTATVVDCKMTITLQKGQTATFLNLPVGDYKVTETDYSSYGYDSNYKVTGDVDYTEGETASVTLERNVTKSVDFMNKFPVGDLVIEKTVTKEFYGTAWSGDTFTFIVERTTDGRPLITNNQYKVLFDGVEQDTKAAVGGRREIGCKHSL